MYNTAVHRDIFSILACPNCGSPEPLQVEESATDGDDVLSEALLCRCGASFPITDGIARFVSIGEDYATNFAFEWQRWGRVQIDQFSHHCLSTDRFLSDSRWPSDWLRGKLILDAGCILRAIGLSNVETAPGLARADKPLTP